MFKNLVKRIKCNHIWNNGTLVDIGRNKIWKCSKCNKIKTLNE